MKFFVMESHHVIKSFVILIYFITNNSLVLVFPFDMANKILFR